MATTKIWIFDVEHGSMAFVRAPNEKILIIDVGCASDFSPSYYIRDYELTVGERLQDRPIQKLIVTHPHDDHIQDIERFWTYLVPICIERNKFDLAEVMEEAHGDYGHLKKWDEYSRPYQNPVPEPDWGNLSVRHYSLGVEKAKEVNIDKFVNNSSIVTVLEVYGFKIVFPGDLEKDGWLELLKSNINLANDLKGTTVLVTSHHGHSSGYVPEIYDAMVEPPLFNFSSIHHHDENIDAAYSSSDRARGIAVGGQMRYSLTTRHDGALKIEIPDFQSPQYSLHRLTN